MLPHELGVLVNILEMHLLDLSLELLFFLVELVHVSAHELLDIDVLVSSAARSLAFTSWTCSSSTLGLGI